jgi:hypothetical protein
MREVEFVERICLILGIVIVCMWIIWNTETYKQQCLRGGDLR